ncbi:GFA family protein [Kineobactrum salinum]|uniref:GFA family protein n=1 Tax=Kineobactrum salinum TaxID=2708301 RepID=A0A6C0U1R0_9GAMM|nr:GFA family protein [Kineobactrum salinum]QIB65723.1 GFA family protein [Kineobactrum salinum]
MKRTGSCLCGAVRVSVDAAATDLGACHCARCRKWSGGPLMELECGSDVKFEGFENIEVFKSSDWAERGFCKVCGSHLFIKSVESGEYGIPPGLFDSDKGIDFNRQVFFDKKPDYYSFSNTTRNITSEYIYEHFPQARDENT